MARPVLRLILRTAEVVFDKRRGIHTRGSSHNEAVHAPMSVGKDGMHYEGANFLLWWQLRWHLPADRHRATFVDVGAGLGRMMILAAELGYRRVIGVELDPDLVRGAEENIARWRARRGAARWPGQEVVVVHGDAATYPLPEGPLVICMYNAFGPTSLRRLVRQVCEVPRTAGDEVFLVYMNSVHASVVDEFPQMAVESRGKRWALYRLRAGNTATASRP
jgi:SAM-dependent methyltransferase